MNFFDKDLLSTQEGRILAENAHAALVTLADYTQADLDQVICSWFQLLTKHGEELIKGELYETGFGNEVDKLYFFHTFLDKLQASLKHKEFVGILSEDDNGDPSEVGCPLGVIVAVVSAKNAVLNTAFAAISALKAGNSLVIVPEKEAAKITSRTVDLLQAACSKNGLPLGTLSCMETIADNGIAEITNGPFTDAVLNIGCPKVLNIESTKPVFYGGTGSTPVFIEKTADIQDTVKAIIKSRSFDNGILPGSEQYIIAEKEISADVKKEMETQHAYFMTPEEEKQLISFLKPHLSDISQDCIGKSAVWLAGRAGFSVPEMTKVLVSEQDYVLAENPYAEELSCPILTFYLEPDWLRACEKCLDLLKSKSGGHTLVIHSKDTAIIREFAMKKPVGRIIVNDSGSFSAMGLTSGLDVSLILGGLTQGKGVTARNVTARDLSYRRQVAYHSKRQLVQKGVADTTATFTLTDSQQQFMNLIKELIQ